MRLSDFFRRHRQVLRRADSQRQIEGKVVGDLRAFFRFCINREWIAKNPVTTNLKPPLGANRVANKAPYTDDELERIINDCDLLGEVKWSSWQRSGGAHQENAMSLDDLILGHVLAAINAVRYIYNHFRSSQGPPTCHRVGQCQALAPWLGI